MRYRARLSAIGLILAWALVPALPALARGACTLRCGHRVATCVLAHGGVDGRKVAPCRREAVAECRRVGARACPLPSREELAATLAAVVAVEAVVHDNPLCAATLPPDPAATVTDALEVGRATAAAIAGNPTLRARGIYGGRVFEKLFIQGTFGHGAAFVPLGEVVRALARPARAVVYAGDSGGAAVYGVVGSRDGAAIGVLLTSCPSD